MEMPVGYEDENYSGVLDWEKECAGASLPEIRFFTVENGRRVCEYQQLIDPCRRIGAGVVALTGITQEMVSGHEVLVGAVGNVRPAKSYDVLLKAAALLRRQALPYRFVVVGEAQGALYQELLALRDQLGLGNMVAFTGFKSDVHDVMNNLDLYASTSTSEGFSLSVVQAMACGVPVVATKSGGPEEIITHDVDGLLVDADSPEQVAMALRRLGTEPGTRERLTQAGRNAVEARFTLTHMVNSYDRLYDECVRAA